MAKKLTPEEVMNLGRTHRLYYEGKTPEEIAAITKYPVQTILEWIEVVKKADEKRAEKEG